MPSSFATRATLRYLASRRSRGGCTSSSYPPWRSDSRTGRSALAQSPSLGDGRPASNASCLLSKVEQRDRWRDRQRRWETDRKPKQSSAGGLIRTALRATDIVMDRVWQLENEIFRDTPGFVFAPFTDVVDQSEDATAMNPEIQQQASRMRTDLDRFSELEISSLIRHGYCVARKACRARPELFGDELPSNEPWDPIPKASSAPATKTAQNRLAGRSMEPTSVTRDARQLQESSSRRIFSTLLDYRDWASYIYVPLLVPILFLMPYFIYHAYQESNRMNQIVSSLRQGSQDVERMNMLLKGPIPPWEGVPGEQVQHFDEEDLNGFGVLQDSCILDLRKWKPGNDEEDSSSVYGYQRLKVMRVAENSENTNFHLRLLPVAANSQFRFPPQELMPALRSTDHRDRR